LSGQGFVGTKVTPGVVTYATNIGRNASRAHYLSKSPFDDLAATKGSVATVRRRHRLLHAPHLCSGCQIEEMVDELDLSRQIISCYPSNLPLPDHVDCFVTLNGSPGRLEFSEPLFGVHSTFDGSMILFKDAIQILHGSVSTTMAQCSFSLTVGIAEQ
jgi:hypothetical protein